MAFLRMEQLDLDQKTVLIREDLNVPVKNGKIVNDTRIRAAIPSLKAAMGAGAKVIVMSHLGRPEEGLAISHQSEFSLAPVAKHLEALLNCSVALVDDYLDSPLSISNTGADIVILENVRANVGEKSNSDELAKRYASLCDVIVMDAFGTAHRAQASTHAVAKFAATACAGPLLAKELDALEKSLRNPERPMLAIVGGAKVSSKLEVLQSLAGKVDQLIVGGGIANTFLAASGFNVGKSLYEPDLVSVAAKLMEQTTIPLPIDVVCAREFSETAHATIKNVSEIADDDLILDIGPQSIAVLNGIIGNMKTIIWNGPVGVFEFPAFAAGTKG